MEVIDFADDSAIGPARWRYPTREKSQPTTRRLVARQSVESDALHADPCNIFEMKCEIPLFAGDGKLGRGVTSARRRSVDKNKMIQNFPLIPEYH